MKCWAAIAALAAAPVFGHRLDEYLQAALVSVTRDRVQIEITLTPGVAVSRIALAAMDTNSDGVISEAEQHSYAERVLQDVSLNIDGHPLQLRLASLQFPSLESMKEGGGEIRIEFSAPLPGGGAKRKLTFENHHQSRIAAYMVNCLVPEDPGIRILAQTRNYSQSNYQLEYQQPGAPPYAAAALALLLCARVGWLWRRKVGPALSPVSANAKA